MHISLTYELEKLEALVKALIASDTTPPISLFHQEEEFQHLLRAEVERVKKNFIREVFGFEDEPHLQRYIQFHQQELIRILDVLQNQLKNGTDPNNSKNNSLQFSIHCFEELLEFIERHFTRYFDQDTKAPESYIVMSGKDVLKALNTFRDQLKALSIEEPLAELLLIPLKQFIEKIPLATITYREIIFTKEVIKELSKLLLQNEKPREGNELSRTSLLYLNYNTVAYFIYFTQYIREHLARLDSASSQIEKLSFFLKSINQTQVKPGLAYNRTLRSLKEQLVDWISEEISYLERLDHLHQKSLVGGEPVPTNFKVNVDLTVSQLAYLIRIFVESKFLVNKNLSDVLRFVSQSTSVKNQAISYESFRVRYYNPEESIRKSVRSLLLQLVDLINKG